MAGKNGRSNGAAPILISGGGIGGLVTAYALARQGIPVRVFEQSPEFREVGAGIQLGPGGSSRTCRLQFEGRNPSHQLDLYSANVVPPNFTGFSARANVPAHSKGRVT